MTAFVLVLVYFIKNGSLRKILPSNYSKYTNQIGVSVWPKVKAVIFLNAKFEALRKDILLAQLC